MYAKREGRASKATVRTKTDIEEKKERKGKRKRNGGR